MRCLCYIPRVGITNSLSRLVEWQVRRHVARFQSGQRESFAVDACVIGVGNLTTGGTGKTPTVMDLARRLKDKGYAVGIVSRGHGGSKRGPLMASNGRQPCAFHAREIGDEPLEMALRRADIPVAIGRDRVAACRLIINEARVRVILLDDGFSHLRLRRDLDLVLINGPAGLGNGLMLPFGPLREPVDHLARAGALIITKGPLADVWKKPLAQHLRKLPRLEWNYRIEKLWRLSDGADIALPLIQFRKPVVIASALGDNAAFARLLEGAGVNGPAVALRDHGHVWKEYDALLRRAEQEGAEWILVTEKDAVKWPEKHRPANVLVVRAGIQWKDENALMSLVEDVIARHKK